MASQIALWLLLMSAWNLVELKPSSERELGLISYENHSCPTDFTSLDNHCYYFSNVSKTWFDAYTYCTQLDTHLATVTTDSENTAVKDYLTENFPQVDGVDGWWFGGIDSAQEGHWVWVTNLEPMDERDWCSSTGDPNNDNGEHCVSFNPSCNFQWNDRSCNFWGFRFICETYNEQRTFDPLS